MSEYNQEFLAKWEESKQWNIIALSKGLAQKTRFQYAGCMYFTETGRLDSNTCPILRDLPF